MIVAGVYVTNSNIRVSQMQEIEQIKEIYEADLADINEIYVEKASEIIPDPEPGPEQKEYFFDYTGDVQTFTVPYTGYYKIEAWGAQGNNVENKRTEGGRGAYTSGEIKLEEGTVLYVYVGEHRTDRLASFNCGSIGGTSINTTNGGGINGYGGGGATDIRTISGEWNDFNSLKSRIMVAAGGGGANDYAYPSYGGYGGELTGGHGNNGKYPNGGTANTPPTGGTQISGGYTTKADKIIGKGKSGEFGIGGDGNSGYGSGGGGGYYGGGGSGYSDYSVDSGAGGSSFISGHIGCNAIAENSTKNSIQHLGVAEHYSGLVFINTSMKNGEESMPNINGSITTIGNEGNGYAKITWIGSNPSSTSEREEYVTENLILHYDGINNTGNGHSSTTNVWKDLSGNNNDGIFSKSLENNVFYWESNNLTLKNVSSKLGTYITTPVNLNEKERTISYIIDATNLTGSIWGDTTSSNTNGLFHYQDFLANRGDSAGQQNRYNYALNKDGIYYYTVTLSADELRFYINGTLQYSMSNTIGLKTSNNLRILAAYYQGQNTSNVKLYQFMVYDRAITSDEVAQNYKVSQEKYTSN